MVLEAVSVNPYRRLWSPELIYRRRELTCDVERPSFHLENGSRRVRRASILHRIASGMTHSEG